MRSKQLQKNIELLKNFEFGNPPRHTPKTPPKYEHLEHRKKIIRIGRKSRNCERSVQIGWVISPFAPFRRRLYITPVRRAEESGKVTLVIASKGVGKTNLTRLFTQAFYRASNFPIIVFQEKKGDLDFTRRPSPEKLIELGIQPIRLPDDCQNILIPGENYRIPLMEIEYSELMDYIGKKVGSSAGDRVIQRLWHDRRLLGIRNLDDLRYHSERYIQRLEEREDTHTDIIRSTMNRFFDLIEMDRLIDHEHDYDFLDIIDPDKINIVDLSELGDDAEKQFVVASTLRMLENHFPRRPCFVAITESHIYAPSNRRPASLLMILRIVTVLARSYGWNILLETQSPQNLNPRIVENVDEVFIFGFISKSKREALAKNLQMNLEDILNPFYYQIRDIDKGEGLYATIEHPNIPYFVKTFLSPVG